MQIARRPSVYKTWHHKSCILSVTSITVYLIVPWTYIERHQGHLTHNQLYPLCHLWEYLGLEHFLCRWVLAIGKKKMMNTHITPNCPFYHPCEHLGLEHFFCKWVISIEKIYWFHLNEHPIVLMLPPIGAFGFEALPMQEMLGDRKIYWFHLTQTPKWHPIQLCSLYQPLEPLGLKRFLDAGKC